MRFFTAQLPRVTWYGNARTTNVDKERFMGTSAADYAIVASCFLMTGKLFYF